MLAPQGVTSVPGVGKRVQTGDADVGRRIRAAREAQGLSQAELASRAGLRSQGYVSGLETGSVAASRKTLRSIARVVGESAGFLLDGPQTDMPNELETLIESAVLRFPKRVLRALRDLPPAELRDLADQLSALAAALIDQRRDDPKRRR
jgi:transcriptional regulator with XRE-family HTH domain